jgi:hypothetical protein
MPKAYANDAHSVHYQGRTPITCLKIPREVRQLFGKPLIMAGEDPADNKELLELVREDVPQDLQEWFLMRDIRACGMGAFAPAR